MTLGPGLGAPPVVGGGERMEEEQWNTHSMDLPSIPRSFTCCLAAANTERNQPRVVRKRKGCLIWFVIDSWLLCPLSPKEVEKVHISTLPYSWHIHVTYPGQWGFRHFSRSFWEGVFFLIKRTEMVEPVLLVRCPELCRPSEESAMQCLTVKYKQSQGPPASENMEKATVAQINLTFKTSNLRTLLMWEI